MDKRRPVLIISNDIGNKHSANVTVATITSQPAAKAYPTDVALAAGDPLPAAGRVLCASLNTIPKAGLQQFRATLRPEQIALVNRALTKALAIPR